MKLKQNKIKKQIQKYSDTHYRDNSDTAVERLQNAMAKFEELGYFFYLQITRFEKERDC